MKWPKNLQVWHVAAVFLAGCLVWQLNKSPEPEPAPLHQTPSCDKWDAYAMAKSLVRQTKGDEVGNFALDDDAQVTHDPAGDLWEVRSYYFTSGSRQVDFYTRLHCRDTTWYMERWTIGGEQYTAADLTK